MQVICWPLDKVYTGHVTLFCSESLNLSQNTKSIYYICKSHSGITLLRLGNVFENHSAINIKTELIDVFGHLGTEEEAESSAVTITEDTEVLCSVLFR